VNAAALAANALIGVGPPVPLQVAWARRGVDAATRARYVTQRTTMLIGAALGLSQGGNFMNTAQGRTVMEETGNVIALNPQGNFAANIVINLPGPPYANACNALIAIVNAMPPAKYTALQNAFLAVPAPLAPVPIQNPALQDDSAIIAAAFMPALDEIVMLEAMVNGSRYALDVNSPQDAHDEVRAVKAAFGTVGLAPRVLGIQEARLAAATGVLAPGGAAGATAPYAEAAAYKVAYSYGHNRNNHRHDYAVAFDGHPNQLAIDMYEARGWTERLNTDTEAHLSAQPYDGKNGWCALGWEDVPGYRGPLRSGAPPVGRPAFQRLVDACLDCGGDDGEYFG
jgi:hypothetical protein